MDEECKKSKKSRSRKKNTTIDEDDDVIMNDDIGAGDDINSKQKEKCSAQDIDNGTASLETFFEHHITEKSDIIETFAFTTIFSIPQDLVSEGMIRLKHHEGLTIEKDALAQSKRLSEEYNLIWNQIESELHFNKVLSESIVKFRKILKFSIQLRKKVNLIDLTHMPKNDTHEMLVALSPLRETYRYLIVELSSAYETLVNVRPQLKDEKVTSFGNKADDVYLNDVVSGLLKKVSASPDVNDLSPDTHSNLELLKRLDNTLNQKSK
ncbi:unnamed protein product [Ambrosiozyma monospora]|uniref:Unnamed protein product n=1 Tax=Ambrosiozyma monospora TaxID=43982 RepID=A0A9W6YZH8_AMBMO|nr:unnamed protein product [Ambrosiozyma monospora]